MLITLITIKMLFLYFKGFFCAQDWMQGLCFQNALLIHHQRGKIMLRTYLLLSHQGRRQGGGRPRGSASRPGLQLWEVAVSPAFQRKEKCGWERLVAPQGHTAVALPRGRGGSHALSLPCRAAFLGAEDAARRVCQCVIFNWRLLIGPRNLGVGGSHGSM